MDATNAYTALQIVQVQVLSESDCTISRSKTTLTRDRGTLDIDLPRSSAGLFSHSYSFKLPLLVANNLESVGGSKATDLNNITVTHFSVELSAPGVVWSDSCPARFDTYSFTRLLEPGASLGTSVTIITPYHAPCLYPTVAQQRDSRLMLSATIWAKGVHGGTSIKSAPFLFSVEVCAGCLQVYNDPNYAQYNHPKYPYCAALTGSNPYQGDRCSDPGQDKTILCCGVPQSDGTVNVLCPAVFTGLPASGGSTGTTGGP